MTTNKKRPRTITTSTTTAHNSPSSWTVSPCGTFTTSSDSSLTTSRLLPHLSLPLCDTAHTSATSFDDDDDSSLYYSLVTTGPARSSTQHAQDGRIASESCLQVQFCEQTVKDMQAILSWWAADNEDAAVQHRDLPGNALASYYTSCDHDCFSNDDDDYFMRTALQQQQLPWWLFLWWCGMHCRLYLSSLWMRIAIPWCLQYAPSLWWTFATYSGRRRLLLLFGVCLAILGLMSVAVPFSTSFSLEDEWCAAPTGTLLQEKSPRACVDNQHHSCLLLSTPF